MKNLRLIWEKPFKALSFFVWDTEGTAVVWTDGKPYRPKPFGFYCGMLGILLWAVGCCCSILLILHLHKQKRVLALVQR